MLHAEVVIEDAKIEQYLDIMFLDDLCAVLICSIILEERVTARLLLYEEPHVCRHEVHTSLQSEFLTDECWLKDSL